MAELMLEDEVFQDDPELEAIRQRVKEMEEEATKIKQLQDEDPKSPTTPTAKTTSGTTNTTMSDEEKLEADTRSIYVGNVDYAVTAEELESHFHGCGAINRITILCNKFTGQPKGFAYVEFSDPDAVAAAQALDDSELFGRKVKVMPKRTNVPGISSTNRPPRRPRATFRSRFGSRFHYGYTPRPRYGGPRFRRRPSYYYSPYAPY